MSDLVETMFSTKLTPWHGKGVILEEHPTSAEAIKAAGLDWRVDRRLLFWNRSDDTVADPVEVPNRRALVRVRTLAAPEAGVVRNIVEEDLLSVVSDVYEPLQNVDAFKFFDPLVRSGNLVYETAGSLSNGQKIWVLTRYLHDPIKIMGTDEVRPYLLLLNGHDGATGVTIMPSFIRVVCNNTLMAALNTGMTINFRHVGDVSKEIEQAKDILNTMGTRFDDLQGVYSEMAETHIDGDVVDAIIRDVCCPGDWRTATTGQPDEEMIKRQGEIMPHRMARLQAMEAKVRSLLRNGVGADAETNSTVWGVYNALVEFADYYLGVGSKDRAGYQLCGEGGRFKQRALAVCRKCVELTAAAEQPVATE